jgi:hypothetical protein
MTMRVPLEYLAGESDIFVGRKARLRRYLVCAMQGYFPVLIKTGDASLAVILRTGAPHIGITGTLAISRSEDGGKCWSDLVQIQPRWDDSRNPAFGVNRAGELVAAFWKARAHIYEEDPDGWGMCYREGKKSATITDLYYCRSTDGGVGRVWTQPVLYASEHLFMGSPYGRIIETPDGTLLMSAYGTPKATVEGSRNACVLLRSTDDGKTWGDETLVARGYNETSYVLLDDGELVAATRSESGHVAVLHSHDLGYTWSKPVQVTRDGEHPADLTLLQSGRLLLTFGRRIRPLGCGVLFSDDGGHSWDTDHEVLLAGDGVESTDIGYPSTVQLADGHIVTVLYYACGSEMSAGLSGWGRVSCQAIHYREEDIS